MKTLTARLAGMTTLAVGFCSPEMQHQTAKARRLGCGSARRMPAHPPPNTRVIRFGICRADRPSPPFRTTSPAGLELAASPTADEESSPPLPKANKSQVRRLLQPARSQALRSSRPARAPIYSPLPLPLLHPTATWASFGHTWYDPPQVPGAPRDSSFFHGSGHLTHGPVHQS